MLAQLIHKLCVLDHAQAVGIEIDSSDLGPVQQGQNVEELRMNRGFASGKREYANLALTPDCALHQITNFRDGHFKSAAIVAETDRAVGVAAIGDFNGHRAGHLPVRGTKAAIQRAALTDRALRVRGLDGRNIKPLESFKPVDVGANQSLDAAVLRAVSG